MNIFLSGDESLSLQYLPTIKSIALNFKTDTEKVGLKQNASHFSLCSGSVIVSIFYIYGAISIYVNATLALSNVGFVEEKLESEYPIWLKAFDQDVIMSYNGRFFSLSEIIDIDYDSNEISVIGVENRLPEAGARIVTLERLANTIEFGYITSAIGINSLFSECYCAEERSGFSVRRSSVVLNGVHKGYVQSAFYSPDNGETLRCITGGDAVYGEIVGENLIVEDFSGSSANAALSFGGVIVGPTLAACKESLISAASNPCGQQIADWYFGESNEEPTPIQTSYFWNLSPYMCMYYSGDATISSKFHIYEDWGRGTQFGPSSEPDFEHYYLCSLEVFGSTDRQTTIKMLDVDGSVITSNFNYPIIRVEDVSVEAAPASFYDGVLSGYPPWGTAYLVASYASGLVPPTYVRASQRGYIFWMYRSIYDKYGAFGFSKATGWIPVLPPIDISTDLDGTYSNSSAVLWGTYSEWYIGVTCPDSEILKSIRRTATIFKRRLVGGNFSYSSTGSITFSGEFVGTIYCSKNLKFIFVYNSSSIQNGVYRASGSSLNLIFKTEDDEIEPILMDDELDVICVRKAVILNNGNDIIPCNNACGVFFDKTHYVDMLQDGSFIMNRILDDLSTVLVDSIPAGRYNFYEFSEDASVCILSNYFLEDSDMTAFSSSNAVVIDYADPVYRFELSDQPIVNFFTATRYGDSVDVRKVGYPTGIPLGARYINVCKCTDDAGYERNHYVYCPYPGGWSTLSYSSRMSPGYGYCCPVAGIGKGVPNDIGKYKTVVPQYENSFINRKNQSYDGVRLNMHIYHHTGKVLRRISKELDPIDNKTSMSIKRRT